MRGCQSIFQPWFESLLKDAFDRGRGHFGPEFSFSMSFTIKVYNNVTEFMGKVGSLFHKFTFRVLSVGPIPTHIAFIMDGNRRYALKNNLQKLEGYKAGFSALVFMLQNCYELGVTYVTVYALSIDNFKRQPCEVQLLMNLLEDKMPDLLEHESFLMTHGVRIHFVGDLKLLNESTRLMAEKAMSDTANNNKTLLVICIAYTFTDEVVHAVQEAWNEKINGIGESYLNESSGALTQSAKDGIEQESEIKMEDIERHMYMSVVPDPDMLVRTSGETRLSNFLLWQTTHCYLHSKGVLWSETSLWHFVWAILSFQ